MGKFRFRLKAGTLDLNMGVHPGGKPKTPKRVVAGEIIESDERLDKIWVNKFERLANAAPAPAKVKAKKVVKPVDDEDSNEGVVSGEEESIHGWGLDVTQDFPIAVQEDLLVYNKNGVFTVTDKARPDVALNKKRKLTEGDVVKFIEKNYAS